MTEDPDVAEPKLGAGGERMRLKMRAKTTTSNFAKWKTTRLPAGTVIKTDKK